MINLRRAGGADAPHAELTYLLGSGSDRIGALDFQTDPNTYVPRDDEATLEQLLHVADLVEAGEPIPEGLAAAANRGTSIGGARPKALLTGDDGRPMIAKFSSSTDTAPVVKAEGLATLLAARVGLTVPDVRVVRSAGRDVLLIDRFDRMRTGAGWSRRSMLSMLTILGENEYGSHLRSYQDIARSIRSGRWTDVPATLHEMFTRLVFNILIGNTDDHLRNHAAFWDGQRLVLTPAYDLSPQIRSTNPAGHAIAILGGQRASQLRLARAVAADFHIDGAEADTICLRVEEAIRAHWDECCDLSLLTSVERAQLMGREFLNPYAYYDQA